MKRSDEEDVDWGLILLRMLMYVASIGLATVLTPRITLAMFGTSEPSPILYSMVIASTVYVLGSILVQIPNSLLRRKSRLAQDGDKW